MNNLENKKEIEEEVNKEDKVEVKKEDKVEENKKNKKVTKKEEIVEAIKEENKKEIKEKIEEDGNNKKEKENKNDIKEKNENKDTKKNKKYIITIIILLLIISALIGLITYFIIDSNKIKGNINNAIHGLINSDVKAKIGNEEINLNKGERVSILKDDILNNQYIVKYNEKIIKLNKDAIAYFKENTNERNSLMLDVSQFNIAEEDSEGNSNKTFQNKKDFELFIVNNNIQYVYIRLGGRGWGKAGNLYYDDDAVRYIESCEYLGIPYGFYYLDEALNENEIIEEVKFVTEFLDENKTNMNILPLVIDLEYQQGKGRTDDIWENRVQLLNRLISEFNKNNIKCILYSNGARIEKYIKQVNCNFWVAMYPQNDIIPENNYKATVKMEQLENQLKEVTSNLTKSINTAGTDTKYYSDEFLNKVIAWQFTESGAEEDGISEHIDLSIVNNKYFKMLINSNIE